MKPVDETYVCRKPFYSAESFLCQPGSSLVLVEMDGFRQKGTDEAMHCQMEFRIVPFHSFKQISDLNFSIQLLADLTPECLLRTLASFHLATGEFPPPVPLTITPLGGKYLFAPHDDCRNYFYSFHIIIIYPYPNPDTFLPILCSKCPFTTDLDTF